jgi:hypothetical protein
MKDTYRILNSNKEPLWGYDSFPTLRDAFVYAMSWAKEYEENCYIAKVSVEIIEMVEPEGDE